MEGLAFAALRVRLVDPDARIVGQVQCSFLHSRFLTPRLVVPAAGVPLSRLLPLPWPWPRCCVRQTNNHKKSDPGAFSDPAARAPDVPWPSRVRLGLLLQVTMATMKSGSLGQMGVTSKNSN